MLKRPRRITLRDLPPSTVEQFDNIKIIAYNTIANLDPWQSLSNDEIAEIWNSKFQSTFPVSVDANSGDPLHQLFTKVRYLVS